MNTKELLENYIMLSKENFEGLIYVRDILTTNFSWDTLGDMFIDADERFAMLLDSIEGLFLTIEQSYSIKEDLDNGLEIEAEMVLANGEVSTQTIISKYNIDVITLSNRTEQEIKFNVDYLLRYFKKYLEHYNKVLLGQKLRNNETSNNLYYLQTSSRNISKVLRINNALEEAVARLGILQGMLNLNFK